MNCKTATTMIGAVLAICMAGGAVQAQTPPPVMVPIKRAPINPTVINAMPPPQQQQGNIECVAVNNVTVSQLRNFTCIEASGKQTKVNFYEPYPMHVTEMERRIAYFLETQIDHSEAMNLVGQFFLAKSANPALKSRLLVAGGTSDKGVYEARSVTLVN